MGGVEVVRRCLNATSTPRRNDQHSAVYADEPAADVSMKPELKVLLQRERRSIILEIFLLRPFTTKFCGTITM